MKKKFKFSVVLSLVLALSMFLAACSGNNDETKSTGGSSSEPSSKAAEKPVELVFAFLNYGNFTDLQKVQDEINKIALEKINATVKLTPIDAGAWSQQMNLQLVGNEPLDLIITSSGLGYEGQATKGQLVALDELIDQYAPEIRNIIAPEILSGAKLSGVTYGIPSVRDYAADYGYIARKDIIEKHQIDLQSVKSFEDLTEIFKTLKEKEPDMYPVTQQSQRITLVNDMISGYIDGMGNNLGVLKYDEDNKTLFNLYESDFYRKNVELAHSWYKAGYLPKDASTSQEIMTSLVKADKVIGYFSNFKPGFEAQESLSIGKEMVAVRITNPVASSSASTKLMISIARNTKNPEKAMQMINLLYTDEDVVNLIDNGIEGVHYVQAGDGTIKMPDGVTEQTYLGTQWLLGNNALAYPWSGTAPDIWEQMQNFNNSAKYSKGIGFSFDTTDVKTEVAAIQNVMDEYRTGIESGTLKPSYIDDFNAKLKAAGLDKMIAEKQKQLDAWWAGQ